MAISNIQTTGDPNDVVYREQADLLSSQAFNYAFDWAKAEAQILNNMVKTDLLQGTEAPTGEQESLMRFERNVEAQIKSLQLQIATLDERIAHADRKAAAEAKRRRELLRSSVEFLVTMKDAAQHIGESSESNSGVGLLADLYSLQHSVPELQGSIKAKPSLVPIDRTSSSGVLSQMQMLLDLLSTKESLRAIMENNDKAHTEAERLRAPVTTEALRLLQQSAPARAGEVVPAADTSRVKLLAADATPLSQEIIALERSRNNLAAWQSSINSEYRQMMSALLMRIGIISSILLIIFVTGDLLLRFTQRYIRDPRRRRQFLVVRRLVVGALSSFVLIVGFISNFSSLATFAGFLTAGIAVALQTVLLSAAAYFFIIGRYGIRIGDRITISSVTGEVIDVGLFRFYLLELAGSGSDLTQTGRIAVFSNAILFQAGTPMFKQIPGSDYSWRELTVTLADAADHDMVRSAIINEIENVYAGYKAEIERQHRSVQKWLDVGIESPGVLSRVMAISGLFQLWVKFPIQISRASDTDDKMTRALRNLMSKRPEIKDALKSTPLIQPAVRG